MEAFDVIMSENLQKPTPSEPNIDPYVNLKKLYPNEFAMSRAAWQRYFSNGEMIDNIWVSSAKKGADINMSERTFKYLQDDIDRINKGVKEGKEMGYEVRRYEITQEYLDHLLK